MENHKIRIDTLDNILSTISHLDESIDELKGYENRKINEVIVGGIDIGVRNMGMAIMRLSDKYIEVLKTDWRPLISHKIKKFSPIELADKSWEYFKELFLDSSCEKIVIEQQFASSNFGVNFHARDISMHLLALFRSHRPDIDVKLTSPSAAKGWKKERADYIGSKILFINDMNFGNYELKMSSENYNYIMDIMNGRIVLEGRARKSNKTDCQHIFDAITMIMDNYGKNNYKKFWREVANWESTHVKKRTTGNRGRGRGRGRG